MKEIDIEVVEKLRDRIMAIPIREYFVPNKRKIILERIIEEFTKIGIKVVSHNQHYGNQ